MGKSISTTFNKCFEKRESCGRGYFLDKDIFTMKSFKIFFSVTTDLISTKFHMNISLVDLHWFPSRNFLLFVNMTFLGRPTLVIIASRATETLMDL